MREPTDIVPIILPGLFRRAKTSTPTSGTPRHVQDGEQPAQPVAHRPPRLGLRALEAVLDARRLTLRWS